MQSVHPISKSIPRPDGKEKAGGAAAYIADFPHTDFLTARFFRSPFTRGTITALQLPELPEGYYAVDYCDVTGENHIALIKNDWPAFAETEIRYKGQIILLLTGPDPQVVDDLLAGIKVEYIEQEPAVTPDDGLACRGGAMHGEDNIYADLNLVKGDPDEVFRRASRIVEGTYATGFQEQLYMEPQGLMVWTEKNGKKVVVQGTMQCPYYVKHSAEVVLGDGFEVRVIQTTTGGGFGGKEDYPEIMAGPLVTAAVKIGKPLRMIFDRTEDLAYTSKRHPSRTRVRTAHDESGRITALDFDIIIDGGAYESYSLIVLQRAVFTSNGVYNFPNARVRGRAVATSTVPSGAFRGFGAPQALHALEMHMTKAAREFKADTLKFRRPYLLKKGDPTITGGTIREEVILDQLIEKAMEVSDFRHKRKAYADTPMKGIGLALMNHGCGFTGDGEQKIIKAKVKIRKNTDDTVDLLLANIDMGQGPRTTMRKVASAVLCIPTDRITYNNPDTDLVPNSGPTVASRTMMVVGYLVQEAAEKLKKIWQSGKAQMAEADYVMPPGMNWNQETMSGDAYAAYGWGVNIVEVETDPVTWEVKVNGVWAVYDVGVPIDDLVVQGQIQGGMSQALGFASCEKLEVGADGAFLQASMADYIVPTSLDFPRTGSYTLNNPYEYGPFGAKGMGEMVHDAGHAAYCAAVEQAVGRECPEIPLTAERLAEIMQHED